MIEERHILILVAPHKDLEQALPEVFLEEVNQDLDVNKIPVIVELHDKQYCIQNGYHWHFVKLDLEPIGTFEVYIKDNMCMEDWSDGLTIIQDKWQELQKKINEEDEIEVEEEEDPLYGNPQEEDIVTDEHGVRYTRDMKRLLGCTLAFREAEYRVPDGVEVICHHAFAIYPEYLTLSIPRSVRIIGSNIFGKDWGKIVIK